MNLPFGTPYGSRWGHYDGVRDALSLQLSLPNAIVVTYLEYEVWEGNFKGQELLDLANRGRKERFNEKRMLFSLNGYSLGHIDGEWEVEYEQAIAFSGNPCFLLQDLGLEGALGTTHIHVIKANVGEKYWNRVLEVPPPDFYSMWNNNPFVSEMYQEELKIKSVHHLVQGIVTKVQPVILNKALVEDLLNIGSVPDSLDKERQDLWRENQNKKGPTLDDLNLGLGSLWLCQRVRELLVTEEFLINRESLWLMWCLASSSISCAEAGMEMEKLVKLKIDDDGSRRPSNGKLLGIKDLTMGAVFRRVGEESVEKSDLTVTRNNLSHFTSGEEPVGYKNDTNRDVFESLSNESPMVYGSKFSPDIGQVLLLVGAYQIGKCYVDGGSRKLFVSLNIFDDFMKYFTYGEGYDVKSAAEELDSLVVPDDQIEHLHSVISENELNLLAWAMDYMQNTKLKKRLFRNDKVSFLHYAMTGKVNAVAERKSKQANLTDSEINQLRNGYSHASGRNPNLRIVKRAEVDTIRKLTDDSQEFNNLDAGVLALSKSSDVHQAVRKYLFGNNNKFLITKYDSWFKNHALVFRLIFGNPFTTNEMSDLLSLEMRNKFSNWIEDSPSLMKENFRYYASTQMQLALMESWFPPAVVIKFRNWVSPQHIYVGHGKWIDFNLHNSLSEHCVSDELPDHIIKFVRSLIGTSFRSV